MILTRHDSHADLVVRALQAGKHAFVEKPLALNDEQLNTIVGALHATPLLATVGFNRQFAPLAQQLSTFYSNRSEPLYTHYRVNAGYIPLNHWTHDPEQGGGRIIGEGCHFVDFITFLVGSAPVAVSAQTLPNNGKYREDNVSMTFTFADGSIGVVDYLANGDKSFPKERVEVFCGGSIAVLDDFRVLETVKNGQKKTVKLMGQDKGHFNEMQALVSGIRSGQAPIPYEQLIGVTKATFAAVESIHKNGEKISI
jgi:predicted dehydrogenase